MGCLPLCSWWFLTPFGDGLRPSGCDGWENSLKKKKGKEKKNLKEIYNKYLAFLKNSDIIPINIVSRRLQGGVLPVYPRNKTYSDRVMLCGDAAGFVNPVSGEGIYYAMASGKLAAETASKSIKHGVVDSQFLSEYEKKWKNDFGRDFKLLKNSTGVWSKSGEKMMKILSNDSYLGDLLFQVISGQTHLYELRLKIIQRYIYARIKYSLKRF